MIAYDSCLYDFASYKQSLSLKSCLEVSLVNENLLYKKYYIVAHTCMLVLCMKIDKWISLNRCLKYFY